jgi:hypothetical protein
MASVCSRTRSDSIEHRNADAKSARSEMIPGAKYLKGGTNHRMKFAEKIKEAGAAGYILLWLLGIPIPILLIIFLLRGCT